VTRLAARALDAASFAPYGHVIERPQRDADATGPGWTWWGETMALPSDGRSFGVGYLSLEPAPLRIDWAERHMRSVEVIFPVADCLVYVGPPEHPSEPARAPEHARFEVFRVPGGTGVVLAPGVWHGAPLAVHAPLTALVLLLERTGADDTTVVRWPDDPIEIALG
jgi:ureidoglycolate hydrolase